MKKVFFIDIDETLLPLGKEGISSKNKEAIKMLQQSGADIYIATGKSLAMTNDVLKEVGVSNSITSNGTVVKEDEQLIFSNPISKEDLNEVKEMLNEFPGAILGGQGNDASYVLTDNKNIYQKYVVPIFSELSVEIPKMASEFEEEIYQMWILGDLTGINVNQNKFDTFLWHKNGLDVVYKNTSKAKAINFLLETKYKGCDVQTYAFGDALNDIKMFEVVDNGIAVSNAKEDLKKVANFVTDNTQNEGIYNFVKEQNLI